MGFVDIIQVIFYGIVEGITEWLPISSTGHLILFENFWPLKADAEFLEMFRVLIQLGAIFAVVLLFFQRLNPFSGAKTSREKKRTIILWIKVVIGCLPAGIVGLLFDQYMEEHFNNWQVVAAMLILYGVLFILVEYLRRRRGGRPRVTSLSRMSYGTAFAIGLFQTLSIIPGTSRSGSTILGATILGVARRPAAEFSFFMAIPVMLGYSALKLVKFFVTTGAAFTVPEIITLLTGMLTAFFVSLLVIKGLLGFVKKHDFTCFGYYRIVLGLLVIAWFVFR